VTALQRLLLNVSQYSGEISKIVSFFIEKSLLPRD